MTEYFSHDYNTRNDAKIKRLLVKHGYLGYGLYWAIVEDLYNNANALPTDYESIAFDLRTDENTVKSILHDFDLFVFNEKIFSSLSVERRLEERKSKSENARKSALSRWNKTERNANALQTQSESNAIKEKKKKEKESKDIEGNIVVRKQKFADSLKSYISQYGKDMLGDFYRYWTEPNKAQTKMRFELEKTWSIAGRLTTWKNNQTKFKKENGKSSITKNIEVAESFIAKLTGVDQERTGS